MYCQANFTSKVNCQNLGDSIAHGHAEPPLGRQVYEDMYFLMIWVVGLGAPNVNPKDSTTHEHADPPQERHGQPHTKHIYTYMHIHSISCNLSS